MSPVINRTHCFLVFLFSVSLISNLLFIFFMNGTGSAGKGNYCIAGHSSNIYKEYLNNLKNIEIGMKIKLYDTNKNCYIYTVTEKFITEPHILQLTLIHVRLISGKVMRSKQQLILLQMIFINIMDYQNQMFILHVLKNQKILLSLSYLCCFPPLQAWIYTNHSK